MAQISFTGAFNAATLSVPDVYLNVQQPNTGVITPASFDVVGFVGVGSWGPVGVAVPLGGTPDLAIFGNPTVRKWDLVTAGQVVMQQQLAASSSASAYGVRVTDGTDTAAASIIGLLPSTAVVAGGGTGYVVGNTVTLPNGTILTVATINSGAILTVTVTTAGSYSSIPTNPVSQVSSNGPGTGATFNLTFSIGLTLTSIYTGSKGNQGAWAIGSGSNSTTAAPTFKLTLQMAGLQGEVFDNIGGTANAFWLAAASAINNGNSALRGPSRLMIASPGASTAAAVAGTGTLAGGTDGTTTITSAVLVGVDGSSRTGIYALRGLGCSDAFIADLDDPTQEANLIAFGQSEGVYVHVQGPAGETPTTGATAKKTAGSDNPWIKRLLGDWTYWNDNFNGQLRLLGPATFSAGLSGSLQPQEVTLNKPAQGVVATQRSRSGNPYTSLDLATLKSAGIDVIMNPIPAGAMFGMRLGCNGSSDATRNLDNWPRLTSFLARSITGPGALGVMIGREITNDFFTEGYDILDNFLGPMKKPVSQGGSGTIQNYQIAFSRANNPQLQTANGEVVANVLIQYLGIAQVFLINMQTGATVVIPATGSTSSAA